MPCTLAHSLCCVRNLSAIMQALACEPAELQACAAQTMHGLRPEPLLYLPRLEPARMDVKVPSRESLLSEGLFSFACCTGPLSRASIAIISTRVEGAAARSAHTSATGCQAGVLMPEHLAGLMKEQRIRSRAPLSARFAHCVLCLQICLCTADVSAAECSAAGGIMSVVPGGGPGA